MYTLIVSTCNRAQEMYIVKARLHYETQLNSTVELSWGQSYSVAGSKT